MDINPLPTLPHRHVCTYTECHGQVESGARIYRFAVLKDESARMVVFFRRLGDVAPEGELWRLREIEAAAAQRIKTELKATKIPLYCPARTWNTGHFNRSLDIDWQGVSLTIWWDTADSTLGDALKPLMVLLRQEIDQTGLSFDKPCRGIVG